MKLRNVKGGRLEELKNLKLVLAAAIDGYSDPKALPQLVITRAVERIEDFRYEDFRIDGYEPDAAISAPVAV